MACSLVRVSIGIEGRWVMGCSSCWTAVRRECWWSSLGESRSYNVAGWVGGEWVVGFVSTVFTDKTEEVYLHRGFTLVSRSRFISWRSRAIKVHRLF